ncbi:hypothetical protein pb186bvf_006736 [Paramecium bursaria]
MSYKINKWDCIIEPIMKNNIQIGGLYIGDIDCAQSQELLRKLQIGAILSVIDEPEVVITSEIIHQTINVPDACDLNLQEYFPRTNEFIERHRQHTNVMVHCYAGISRSPTVVIAYIMNKFDWSFQRSMKAVIARRQQVKPNDGFIKQLINYDSQKQRPSSQNRILDVINNVTGRTAYTDTKSQQNNNTYFKPLKVDLTQIEVEISRRQQDLENLRKKYAELSIKSQQRNLQNYNVSPFKY